MKIKLARDGAKNLILLVYGMNDDKKKQTVFNPAQINIPGFKLDQILYSIEKDTTLRFGWEKDGVFLPLEGRGLLNYYQFDSLQPDTIGQSLWIQVNGVGAYHLALDLTKLGV